MGKIDIRVGPTHLLRGRGFHQLDAPISPRYSNHYIKMIYFTYFNPSLGKNEEHLIIV